MNPKNGPGISSRHTGFNFPRVPGGAIVGFADGSARFLRESTLPEDLRAVLTRSGGESVDLEDFWYSVAPKWIGDRKGAMGGLAFLVEARNKGGQAVHGTLSSLNISPSVRVLPSAGRVGKSFPRLRFGLVFDVSNWHG